MGLADSVTLNPPSLRDSGDWRMNGKLTINKVLWDAREVNAVLDVFKRDYFAQAHYVDAFQQALAAFLQPDTTPAHRDAVLLTNSGSSALDVAVKALLATGRIHKGDLALHPALTFNTSATSIVNNGLVPLFVDAQEGTYNIDPALALAALKRYPVKLIVLPFILGNTTHLDQIVLHAMTHHIPIIGDSCDTLGTEWRGAEVGAWADMTAYSFYGSHHISTAGVGGALRVQARQLDVRNAAHSLIYWGRNFDSAYRYDYITLGGDSQMTEIQAAFGLAQLEKLPAMNARRREVFAQLYALCQQWEEYFILPQASPHCNPSWFGFPLTLRDGAPFTRAALTKRFDAAQVEWRPMFSGNTTRQQAWTGVHYEGGGYHPVADKCYHDTFFLPAWAMPDEALQFLMDTLSSAMAEILT